MEGAKPNGTQSVGVVSDELEDAKDSVLARIARGIERNVHVDKRECTDSL